MRIDLKRFHAAFFDETAEHLAAMEESLLELERNPEDREHLSRIFRAAHSIKGASGTFGFTDIAAFTHSLEGLLDKMRDGRIAVAPALVNLLLSSADTLGGLVAAAKDGASPPDQVDSLIALLEAAKNGAAPPSPVSAAAASPAAPAAVPVAPAHEAPAVGSTGLRDFRVTFYPGPELVRHGMDPLLLLRELAGLGEFVSFAVDGSGLPELADLAPEECYLGWTIQLRTAKDAAELHDVFLFVEDTSRIGIEPIDAPASSQPAQAASPSAPSNEPVPAAHAAPSAPAHLPASKSRTLESSSIRVSVEKVDELLNLVGELVIAQSMVNQAMSEVPPETLQTMQEALSVMSRSTRDLQDRVMSVRMVPLASVFRRFPRVVHDLAGALGKDIAVEISGEDTELDKQMIEQITDPLTHLVRNAVDHGIETPEERTRVGKPARGRLGLRAYGEGGSVVIEVSDDGHGLDRARIFQKAVKLGLMDAGDSPTDDQVYSLIFAPGFSTAERVTDVSGRGVGMDVVKRNITAMNGSVSIESVPGQGSIFRIRLPLTLAIVDGLAAALDGEIYILPLLSVIESFQPKAHEVKSIAGNNEMVMVRGKPVPLIRLHSVLNTGARVTDPTQGLVILAENQGKRMGLLVDELIGQMQVVMKSLEANYEKVEGISAATILGDGQVAFILDLPGLARMAHV